MSSCSIGLVTLSIYISCFLAKGYFLIAAAIKAYINCFLNKIYFIKRFLDLFNKGILKLLLNLRLFPPSWLTLILLLLLLLSEIN